MNKKTRKIIYIVLGVAAIAAKIFIQNYNFSLAWIIAVVVIVIFSLLDKKENKNKNTHTNQSVGPSNQRA